MIDTNRLIIGVVIGNEAKAYPINVIAHHHQVKDKIAGQEILVTYCSVCRTGKVYNPTIKGKSTDFRLVGMDHFNAMFEDPETKSWWRQVNGTCIVGELKGEQLKEITCYQTTLKTWLALYPQSLILQQDPEFKKEYKDLEAFDNGSAKSSLIGRNKKANEFKSWVVWANNHHQIDKADWTSIEKDHYVYFHEGQRNTLIVSNDNQSVFAFDVTDEQFKSKSIQNLNLKIIPNETMFTVYLETNNKLEPYLFTYKGEMINQMPLNQPKITLKPIPCSQEFKHSFDQFQGKTK